MDRLEHLQLLVRWMNTGTGTRCVREADRSHVGQASCTFERVDALINAAESDLQTYVEQLRAQGWNLVSSIAPSQSLETFVFVRDEEVQNGTQLSSARPVASAVY